jgi:all-trans-retinol 13,14-reductase
MKRYDVVCIGSGISSLTAAILLAQQGKKVAVLEQHYLPGGYLHAFRKMGHSFDTGAHYVGAMGKGQPFRALLEYLGVYQEDIFYELDPAGFDELRFPDLTVSIAKSYERTIDNLATQFPNERKAIRDYFRQIAEAARAFPTYNFRPETDISVMLPLLETSLQTVVEKLTTNPQLKAVLYTYCALHGVIPKDLPFGLHAIVTDSLIRGPYGFRTNGNALAKSFVDRLTVLGGEVHLRTNVLSLPTSGDEVKSVITDKGEFQAEWVIGGIHPKALFSMLSPSPLSPLFRSRVEKMEESMGIFGLYAVCKPDLALDPRRNYYFFGTNDPEKMFPLEPSPQGPTAVFLSRSSRADKPGTPLSLNFHSAGPAEWFREWKGSDRRERPAAYQDFKKAYAGKMLDLVEARGLEVKVPLEQFLSSSSLSNEFYNPSPDGSAYGIYHSFQNTGLRALGPRTKVKNLLLTGQNTLFPGLLAAAVAGLRTAGNVIGMKPTLAKLREMLDDPDGPPARPAEN